MRARPHLARFLLGGVKQPYPGLKTLGLIFYESNKYYFISYLLTSYYFLAHYLINPTIPILLFIFIFLFVCGTILVLSGYGILFATTWSGTLLSHHDGCMVPFNIHHVHTGRFSLTSSLIITYDKTKKSGDITVSTNSRFCKGLGQALFPLYLPNPFSHNHLD